MPRRLALLAAGLVGACARKADTGETAAPVEVTADVLVIGAGSAGLAAAIAAREAGAEVFVAEREDEAGGSSGYAGSFLAAGTEAQAELGVPDDAATLLAEWSEITGGGDPDDPTVRAFVEESADTLDWLVATTGASVLAVTTEFDTGALPRKHWLSSEVVREGLVAAAGEAVHTGCPATALLVEDGAVVGADLACADGDLRVRAPATVLATGGFARDLDRVRAQIPELAEAEVLFEAAPVADGGGLGLAEQAGAATHNEGHYGVYVHATGDWRAPGEALWPASLASTLIVDAEGRRPVAEDRTRSLAMLDVIREVPGHRLWAIFPPATWETTTLGVPAYNWVTAGQPESIPAAEAEKAGAARRLGSLDAVAELIGADPDALAATFAAYQEVAEAGGPDPMGKAAPDLVPLDPTDLPVLPIDPGAAKAFTGVRTDEAMRVLDAEGAPIPGLWAAGEVAGMLGTEAVGRGFGGSACAVTWGGRRAGEAAAAYSASKEKL